MLWWYVSDERDMHGYEHIVLQNKIIAYKPSEFPNGIVNQTVAISHCPETMIEFDDDRHLFCDLYVVKNPNLDDRWYELYRIDSKYNFHLVYEKPWEQDIDYDYDLDY